MSRCSGFWRCCWQLGRREEPMASSSEKSAARKLAAYWQRLVSARLVLVAASGVLIVFVVLADLPLSYAAAAIALLIAVALLWPAPDLLAAQPKPPTVDKSDRVPPSLQAVVAA